MNLNDVSSSKYLTKEDVGNGILVTISRVVKENVAMEGAEPTYKVCLHFNETEKPLVLNSTNAQIIAKVAGTEEDIEKTWLDKAIVLYIDPNVQYKKKLVGGIQLGPPSRAS